MWCMKQKTNPKDNLKCVHCLPILQPFTAFIVISSRSKISTISLNPGQESYTPTEAHPCPQINYTPLPLTVLDSFFLLAHFTNLCFGQDKQSSHSRTKNTNPTASLPIFTTKLQSSVLVCWLKLVSLLRGTSNTFEYYIQIYLKNLRSLPFYVKNFEELAFTPNQSKMHFTRLSKPRSCSGLSLCPPISFSTSIYLPPIEITATADEVYQVYQTKTAARTSTAPN